MRVASSQMVWLGLLHSSSHRHANVVAQSTVLPLGADKELLVQEILEKMEADALLFRDEIERVYADRCNTDTLNQCTRNNYDDCTSIFPNQMCMDPDELIISACGTGDPCNALWGKESTTVSIPGSKTSAISNPTDPEIIETVCYSRQAEPFMIEKYKQNEVYWNKYGVAPSWTYFGAHNGAFRQHPSVHSELCGSYDPRRRPWYVAASSGPKDVVLVIDTSGSMDDYGRINLAREAAKTIVETLTVADRVAIVAFSNNGVVISGQDRLFRATKANKDMLLGLISKIRAKGGTNFYAGFETAFNALDTTIREESTTGCNIAILFLTDGQITDGGNKNEVVSLVNSRIDNIKKRWNRDTYVFTYSLGSNADHNTPKTIACQTGGLWSPVDDMDFGGDLVTSMASYYKLFALGLGEGDNEDFAAWSEPYIFFSAGKLGTTVSAPVFDRSVDPPLFLGVVGVDSYMDALEQVVGEDAASLTMLDRFVRLSTARCPKLNLTECELDALRFLGGGDGATCGKCSESQGGFPGIVPEECRTVSDYPKNLWKNTEMAGMPYHERACCELGTSEPSENCTGPVSSGINSTAGAIIGIVLAVLAALLILVCCLCCCKKQHKKDAKGPNKDNFVSEEVKEGAPGGRPIVAGSGTAYDGISVAMPTAPPANPSYSE